MHKQLAVRSLGFPADLVVALSLSLAPAFAATAAQDSKPPVKSPPTHVRAVQAADAPPAASPAREDATAQGSARSGDQGTGTPAQTPIVIPGLGTVAWASALASPPTIVPTRNGVSATWTQLDARGSRTTYTLASADGRSFAPPIEFDQRILLRSAQFDPLVSPPAFPTAALPDALASGPDTNTYIVQFTGAIVPGMLQDLAEAGAAARAYLPNFAYIATIPPERLVGVRALACVRAVVPYHPAYRLDQAVRTRVWDNRKSNFSDAPSLYNLQTLVPGPSLKDALMNDVLAAGGAVDQVTVAGSLVRALLTPDQVLQVVRSDALLFIDDAGFPEQDMDLIRLIVGANEIEDTLGYSGQGVHAMVVDDNIRQSHAALQSPPVNLLTQVSGDPAHGTSCYGIMFGDGSGYAPGRGLMPDAQQGYFADFDYMTDRVQLAITAADATNRCVVQSNSWGHPWTFGYTIDSYEADLAAFSSGMLIVQSQSNSGMQWSRPEAWAKNVLSVGGIVHWNTSGTEDDCHCGLASTGPAADGRIKPDLALHNDRITTTTGTGDLAYTFNFAGTSASTPAVAGCAGLVYQMWHEGAFPGFGGATGGDVYATRPAPSTIRALLVNTAFRYDFSGFSSDLSRFKQGWGIPRLQQLYNLREGMMIVDQSMPLQQGQSAEFPVIVERNTVELNATMVYRDPPGTTSSLVHRINDLTLRAVSPTGLVYWGNASLSDGNISIPNAGGPDNRNPIENLFIRNPEAGAWTVTVFASEVNQDSRPETPDVDADFSLVLTRRIAQVCDADWNQDDVVNSTDVSDFVNEWFQDQVDGTDHTDVDANGVANSTDVSSFINRYFDNLVGGCG